MWAAGGASLVQSMLCWRMQWCRLQEVEGPGWLVLYLWTVVMGGVLVIDVDGGTGVYS